MDNTSFSAVSNVSNISSTKTLEELNSEESFRRLPVIVFISIMIFIGTIGNSHVIYIYYRFFNRSTYRNFVLSLATIDITSCVVSMPFEIYDELYPYLFHAKIACKIFRFINVTLAIGTGFMLVVISSERYRRICKPFGNQLTERQSLIALLIVIGTASGVSLPCLYIYGTKSIHIRNYDGFGSECTWGDHLEGSAVGYIFYGAILLIILGCMISLIVLYSLVGKYLWNHARSMKSNAKKKYQIKEAVKLERIEEETPEDVRRARDSFRMGKRKSSGNGVPHEAVNISPDKTCDNTKHSDGSPCKRPKKTSPLVSPVKSKPKHINKQSKLFEVKALQTAFRNVTGRKAGVNPLLPQPEKNVPEREKRITIVLFTITVLFIVSFLPYIVILILYSTNEAYEESMSGTQHIVYLIGLRLYLLNNVSNPFLYSSFDSKFRQHLTDIYSFINALM